MGKAARWFRSLLGGGRKDQERQASPAPAPADRKRWSFARPSRDSAEASAAATEGSVRGAAGSAAIARAAWLRSLDDDTGRRQSKHAIAVAAATAAAADAAVAAAQAAVEVVRLTSQGPAFGGGGVVLDLDPRGRAGAAVKIQTAFRGFLAKKALRALKALVRLQALVRGYLVRRQATVTLQSMQALVRAQATVRAARCGRALPSFQPRLHHPPARPRFSLQERHADDARSEHGVAACGRRLSASVAVESASYDRSPKTVEMDTARPRSRAPSLRTEDEWCAQPVSSPPPPCQQQHHHHLPPCIEVPTPRHFPDHGWCTPEKPRPATAQCTPRCAPPTPTPAAKTLCGGPASCLAASPSCPGYMSSTQSSEAKSSSRSQSAPKQRPARKRVPLSEVVVLQARASLGGAGGGAGTHIKPCNARAQAQAPDACDLRAAVVSRFEQRASEEDAAAAAERGRDVFFLQRRW